VPAIWIVKIGGSLAGGARLRAWLSQLAACREPPIVIVPGGGRFADEVRRAQAAHGFGDVVAHRMAILAMEQYGHMMAGIEPLLRPSASPIAIARAFEARRTVVWLPGQMALGRPEIAESWEVTSDSLAAWLASELDAEHLVLVKAAPPPGGSVAASALATAGLVDAAFPLFLGRFRGAAWCISARRHAAFAAALAKGTPTGLTRVLPG
jgi:aspartokinase-like uncharacterized kinase